MNWIDICIILILLLHALIGWRRGIILGGLEILGFFLCVFFAFFLYSRLSPVLESVFHMPSDFAKAGAFIFLWFISSIVYSLLMRRFYRRVPTTVRSSRVNKVLGVIPALVRGLVMVALLALLFVAAPGFEEISKAIQSSQLGKPLANTMAVVEQHAQDIFGGAIRDTMTFLTVEPEPKSKERIDLGFKTTDVQVDVASEEEMLKMVNHERTTRGLRPLKMDPRLRAVARMHSKDMFARGYFAHVTPDGVDPFERMHRMGIRFGTAGENLALAPNVEIAHSGLMQSPRHRANILNPSYRKIGIGVIKSRFHGRMFSQEFTN